MFNEASKARARYWSEVNGGGVVGEEGASFARLVSNELVPHWAKSFKWPLGSFRSLECKIRASKVPMGESLLHLKSKAVAGSARKSFFEIAAKGAPEYWDRQLQSNVEYVFVRREALTYVSRAFPVSVTPHAAQRYIERSEAVEETGCATASLLEKIEQNVGAFVILAHVAGAWEGSDFAVPLGDGLMLCEAVPAPPPLITRLDRTWQSANAKLAQTVQPHRLLWVGEGRGAGLVQARTYIGPSEMRPWQRVFHRFVNRVFDTGREELALIRDLCGLFHPEQNPALLQKLEEAIPVYDRMVMRIAQELAAEEELAYAFERSSYFHVSSVKKPSQSFRDELTNSEYMNKAKAELGAGSLYGPLFAYYVGMPPRGMEGAAFQTRSEARITQEQAKRQYEYHQLLNDTEPTGSFANVVNMADRERSAIRVPGIRMARSKGLTVSLIDVTNAGGGYGV